MNLEEIDVGRYAQMMDDSTIRSTLDLGGTLVHVLDTGIAGTVDLIISTSDGRFASLLSALM